MGETVKRPISKRIKGLPRRVRKGKPRRPQRMRCPAFGYLCWDKPDHACREYAPPGTVTIIEFLKAIHANAW